MLLEYNSNFSSTLLFMWQQEVEEFPMSEALREELLQKVEDESKKCKQENIWNWIWNESKTMWVIAAPAIFTRFTTFGTNVITQAFVGHIGATELAAYSLVQTVLLRFANGILVCSC